jgi:UDP-2,4-diacetamido-2,4,6-trideoxy-beta-L-altropyranose hydrolase
MKVAFRTDASLHIGTGHVMRCLTLADALAAKGAKCEFICRAHEGHLIEFIRSNGYVVHALPMNQETNAGLSVPMRDIPGNQTAHSRWLGASQTQDAEACAPILAAQRPDWLIVDHYALDAQWERALVPHYRKLMVIDDLADRPHACNLLLDQTFGRDEANYRPLVPTDCRLLCGSQYALLRPEFAALRPYSLQRRARPALRELLITMGGVDKDNATGQVLQALCACSLHAECRITVVMGATAPWLEEVRTQAQDMPWPTRVLVGVSEMAQLMADSDLAIGAAGATSWERCCLGLPTIMLVLAENQRKIAEGLCKAGAAHLVDMALINNQPLIAPKYIETPSLSAMSCAAAAITDGLGAEQVMENLMNKVEYANQLAVQ